MGPEPASSGPPARTPDRAFGAPTQLVADGDTLARQEALDPQGSFIVRAPAGSGKTALLTQRVLQLLRHAEAPEEIVAITFTRKAAAEMRERVLNALKLGECEAAPEAPLDRELWALARGVLARGRERGWSITRHPNRLRIQTIDGFCHALAWAHPWRSGLGGAVRSVEDPEPLYRDAVRATLRLIDSRDPEDLPSAKAMAHVLRHRDVRVGQVEAMLMAMLARRDQWLRYLPVHNEDLASLREEFEQALGRIVTAALTGLRNAAEQAALRTSKVNRDTGGTAGRAFGQRLATLVRFAIQNADPEISEILAAASALDDLPGTEAGQVNAWLAVAELLLTQTGEWRSPRGITIRLGFPPGAKDPIAATHKADLRDLLASLEGDDGLRSLLFSLKALPGTRYSDSQWETLRALVILLRVAVAHLRERFAEAGVVDFVEMAQAAGRVVADPAWTGTLGIRHILLDECQDASHGQFQLIERLTADWRPDDGRTLFLVGDPMQSIYRFREADVGLFLAAETGGIGGLALKPLTLERNFRSLPEIVGANNRTFAAIFPKVSEPSRGAVAFSPARPVRSGPPTPALDPRPVTQGVHVHPVVERLSGDGADGDGAEVEAALVADLARAALADSSPASVAILVQARTHLEAILPALAAAKVPVQAVALTPLDHCPAVLDLLSLARALLYPGDRIAWLSVLRAPWCGLGLGEMEALVTSPIPIQSPTLWERVCAAETNPGLNADARARLRRIRNALLPALANVGRLPLRETVEGAWLSLGGPACTAPSNDPDVRRYFATLESIEADGASPTPEELARRLALQRSVPGAEARPAVQVMTIHEAKGLEFGTVILPGLHRGVPPDERPLLRWLELPAAQGFDLVLAPIPAAGADPEAIHLYLDGLERTQAMSERHRLLYVACTRPMNALHLVGVARVATARPGATEDPTLKTPRKGTFLAALWPTVEPDFSAKLKSTTQQSALPSFATRDKPQRSADKVMEPAGLTRLAATWQLPPLSKEAGPPISHDAPSPEPERIVFDWAGPEARLIGTVVHALLQRVAREGIGSWERWAGAAAGRAHGSTLLRMTERLLTQAGLVGPRTPAAAERVLDALKLALADPRGRWVLGEHRDARQEWALTAMVDGRARRMVLDRTFIDPDGIRWIVDYKTGSHAGGDLDEFLDRECDRYRSQLEGYGHALQALDPARPIRCGLYFPLALTSGGTGGWRDWEFSGLAPAR